MPNGGESLVQIVFCSMGPKCYCEPRWLDRTMWTPVGRADIENSKPVIPHGHVTYSDCRGS